MVLAFVLVVGLVRSVVCTYKFDFFCEYKW